MSCSACNRFSNTFCEACLASAAATLVAGSLMELDIVIIKHDSHHLSDR